MANVTTIVIQDGAATPVNRTFTPNQGTPVDVRFVELSASGILKARPTLELRVKPLGANGRTTQEVNGTLAVPIIITETVNGLPVERIIGTDYAHFRVTSSGNSTETSRKNARTLLKNLLANPTVVSLVDKAESFVGAAG